MPSSSCLAAVHEEPPPDRADELADPVRDVSADHLAALACWALAPDHSHCISLGFWGVFTRIWPALRRGRPPRGRPTGVPGNPPEPGRLRRYFASGRGNNRATMRSAVLTVALPQMSCLRELTTAHVDD